MNEKMISKVKADVPHLNFNPCKETCEVFYSKVMMPSAEIIEIIDQWILRMYFVFTGGQMTREQKEERDTNRTIALWLERQIKEMDYRGQFAIIRFGYVFTFDINFNRQDRDQHIITTFFAVSDEGSEVRNA